MKTCFRLVRYSKCSPSCYVLMLIYIDRLIAATNLRLSELNIHRVMITALLLAAKFFDDEYFHNSFYAKLGGISLAELNALELEFLLGVRLSAIIAFLININS